MTEPVPEPKLDKTLRRQINERLGYLTRHLDQTRWHYDRDEADRWLAFIREYGTFTSGKWKGRPFDPSPWQEYLWLRPLFGWRDKTTKARMIRESLIIVGKGGGKTEAQAIIQLGGLCIDGENSPENYGFAGDEEQAKILFNATATMVEQNETLSSMLRVYRGSLVIEHRTNGGFFKTTTSAPETKDGARPHFVTADEVHVLQSDELLNVFLFGMSKREQPLMNYVTTFGKDLTNRPLGRLHEYGEALVKGDIVNPRFQYLCFKAPELERENWAEPRVWAMANPNYPECPSHDFLEGLAKKAEIDPAAKRTFLMKYLNLETQVDESFIEIELWRNGKRELTLEDFIGQQNFLGFDLASTDDLNALVLECLKDDFLLCKSWFWIPEKSIAKRPKILQDMYLNWRDQGALTTVPGRVMPADYEPMRQQANVIREVTGIRQGRYDPNKATLLVKQLEKDGFDMVPVPPTFRYMGPATRLVKTKVTSEKALHDNNPVMNWNMQKAVTRSGPGDDYILDKAKAQEKIDGAAALCIGASGFLGDDPEDDASQLYAANGIEFL